MLFFLSLDTLFINGDNKILFSLLNHGYFYYFEIITITFGLILLQKRHLRKLLFLITLIMIGLIPAIIRRGDSFFHRGSLIFPLLTIISGTGMHEIITFIITTKKSSFLKLVFTGTIILSILNFMFLYLFYYPVKSSKFFFFEEKVMSEYLGRLLNNDTASKAVVIGGSAYDNFRAYLFYNQLVIEDNAELLQLQFSQMRNKYQYNNLIFVNNIENLNLNSKDLKNTTFIVHKSKINDLNPNLGKIAVSDEMKMAIASPIDSAQEFFIFNDNLCTQYKKSDYVIFNNLNDLNIKSKTKDDFCNSYFMKVDNSSFEEVYSFQESIH